MMRFYLALISLVVSTCADLHRIEQSWPIRDTGGEYKRRLVGFMEALSEPRI